MSIFANGEFKQQFRGNLPTSVRIWVTLRQVADNNVQIRTCLLQHHSQLQSSQTGKRFVITARKKIVIGAEICEENDNVAIARETNALGNNTDDFARHTIDIQTLSKRERLPTETISPEPLADQHNLGRAR